MATGPEIMARRQVAQGEARLVALLGRSARALFARDWWTLCGALEEALFAARKVKRDAERAQAREEAEHEAAEWHRELVKIAASTRERVA